MLSGRAEVELTSCKDIENTVRISLGAGEGIQIPPHTIHDFKYVEDSIHLQLLDKRFDPINQDLFPYSSDAGNK